MSIRISRPIAKVGKTSVRYSHTVGSGGGGKGGCGCSAAVLVVVILLIIGLFKSCFDDTPDSPEDSALVTESESVSDTLPVATNPSRSFPQDTSPDTAPVPQPPKQTETQAPKPVETEPPKKEEKQTLYVTFDQSARAGEYTSLTLTGKPNTKYIIKVYYSSGASKAKGLEPQTTDADGKTTWTWKIGASTSPGKYKLTIEESGKPNTRVTINFEVQ